MNTSLRASFAYNTSMFCVDGNGIACIYLSISAYIYLFINKKFNTFLFICVYMYRSRITEKGLSLKKTKMHSLLE